MSTMNAESYCGINCSTCRLFIATAADDINQKMAIARDWQRLFNWQIELNEMNCKGCKSLVVFGTCASCRIKECAKHKSLDQCSSCDDYPCDKIETLKAKIGLSNPGVTFNIIPLLGGSNGTI